MKQLTILLLIVTLLLVACTSTDVPAPSLKATVQPVLITSTPQPDSMLILDQLNCASETARDIVLFQQIEPGMSFAEICPIVGWPDRDVASGVYAFVYDLDDGSQVTIRFSNYFIPVFSVLFEYPDGTRESLFGDGSQAG